MEFTTKYNTKRRSIWHEIIIATGVIALVLFIGFASLTGYYIWRIRIGDLASLSKQFSGEFTTATSLTDTSTLIPTLHVPASSLVKSYSPTIGEVDAPIQLTMFLDFECPFSQSSYAMTKDIIDKYGSALRVVFKHLPISSIHPRALDAHLASACAQDQGAFEKYYDLLFTTRDLSEGGLLRHARTLGLDIPIFSSCLENRVHEDDIEQDIEDGMRVGVRGTPTYFVNQTKLEGVLPVSVWGKTILDSLQSI
jgi:protein-disulfide isomerase